MEAGGGLFQNSACFMFGPHCLWSKKKRKTRACCGGFLFEKEDEKKQQQRPGQMMKRETEDRNSRGLFERGRLAFNT